MRVTVHRLLAGATLPLLALAGPVAATPICTPVACVDPGTTVPVVTVGDVDPNAQLCLYDNDTKPSDWRGGAEENEAVQDLVHERQTDVGLALPYLFVRTRAWGYTHPKPVEWDHQQCLPACNVQWGGAPPAVNPSGSLVPPNPAGLLNSTVSCTAGG
jgi:hypothetical protein